MASFYTHNNVTLTKDSAEQIEQCHMKLEEILHFMFCDATWTQKMGSNKKLRVLFYCLYYGGTTVRQLQMTNISPSIEYDSTKNYLMRLVEEGLLVGMPVDISLTTIIFYMLTPRGCDYCMKRTEELFKQKGCPLDSETLQYLKKQYRFTKGTAFTPTGHIVSTRDLVAYLLSQLKDTRFSYQMEIGVSPAGVIYSISELLYLRSCGLRRTNVSFQSDALLTYTSGVYSHGETYQVLVEQDMYTQHLNVLNGKINNYVNVLAAQVEKPYLKTTLFTLQTRDDARTGYELDNIRPKRLAEYLRNVPPLAYLMLGENWMDEPLSKIIPMYYLLADKVPCSKRRLENTGSKLAELEQSYPDIMLGDLLELAGMVEKSQRKQQALKRQSKLLQQYRMRRDTFYKAVLGTSNAHRMFMYGFSICTAPNHGLEQVVPYTLPNINNAFYERIRILSQHFLGVPADMEMSYESFVDSHVPDGFGFRHHFSFSSSDQQYVKHVVVENISDDFGGLARVKEYVNTLKWSPFRGTLICLVSTPHIEDDALPDFSDFTNLIVNTPYLDAVQYHTVDSLPLRVVCVPYERFYYMGHVYEIQSDLSYKFLTPER